MSDLKDEDLALAWQELSEDRRRAILEAADSRLFYESVAQRLRIVGKAGQWFLGLVAFATLFREQLASWLQWVMK